MRPPVASSLAEQVLTPGRIPMMLFVSSLPEQASAERDAMSKFNSSLNRFRRGWRAGRIVLALLVLAALFVIGMLIHGWADYKLALSSAARERFNLVLYALLAIVGLVWMVRIFATSREAAAAMADQKLADPRQRVLAAASLEKVEAQTEMEQFHLGRALDDASRELDKLPASGRFPTRALGFAGLALLLVGGTVLGLYALAPAPFRVTATRVFNPHSNLPPYSPLVFEVTPDAPRALYGGEAVVQVKITGGEIEDDVVCLIRNSSTGEIEEATAYREGKQSFARKFENALAPVEFAFAAGRARSDWHRLDVLLQPKVSAARVTVTPPQYTGRKVQSYPLDSAEIKVLEGSTVALELESNRPLSAGRLELSTLDKRDDAAPEVIDAVQTGDKGVTFSWEVHRSAKVSAMIRDVRSTQAASPMELTVTAIPDQVPVVDLSSPEQMVLATPETELPFLGEVEDDHGLAKVSLVRALLGYRDRSRTLADALVKKEFEFKEPLKLAEIGVEAGQVLEFYLEAADRNPSLLGVGVSDVVRVMIISEEEYAERLRAQTRLEEFTERYRALAEAVAEAREALQEMDGAADTGDPEALEEARKQARRAHAEAEELARKIAEDFQAFSMEGRLSEIANEAADALGQNKNELGKLDLSKGEAAARLAIRKMQERLGAAQKRADEILLDAEDVKKAAKVMEMAAKYQQIYQNQKSLTERIGTIAKEIAKGTTRNAVQLAKLGRQQELNRKALEGYAKELEKRAADLPPVFAQMQQDVDQFLQLLEQLDIPNPMGAAAAAAEKGKSIESVTNAALALSLMEKLMQKPGNGFCKMCQGGGPPRFQIKQDVNQTMQEMMQALMNQGGSGTGQGKTGGAGGGMGGSGEDGFSMAGMSTNIPVYGPDRMAFSPATGRAGGAGKSRRGGGGVTIERPREKLDPDEHREPERTQLLPENIPEKYRTAVKRYFSQEPQAIPRAETTQP